MGFFFGGGNVSKITTILKIPERGHLERPKSRKIMILIGQSVEHPLRTGRFLHSCFQHFLTTCLEKSVANRNAKLAVRKEMARWRVMRAAHIDI